MAAVLENADAERSISIIAEFYGTAVGVVLGGSWGVLGSPGLERWRGGRSRFWSGLAYHPAAAI